MGMKLPQWLSRRKEQPSADAGFLNSGADYDAISMAFGMFTGATIPGTMSMPRPWSLDYYALRERSWQAYTENELASGFIDRLRHFTVNVGLKLQYEQSDLFPMLSDEDAETIEKDFGLYASSNIASLTGDRDLHALADQAYLNMLVGGDLLVVLHVRDGEIKVQHIDGRYLVTPFDRGQQLAAARQRNTIVNGIEFDKYGREVAYHVREDNSFAAGLSGADPFKIERIPAYGPSGRRIAFRPFRDNQRIGMSRGKPILTPVLQNLEIVRRYKLAELLAAEVNAKLVASVEHDERSFGNNPFQKLPYGSGRSGGQAQEMAGASWSTSSGDEIAGRVGNLTGAVVTNLGRGQKLVFSDTKRPNLDGAAFLERMNIDTAAAVNIPYEIARMMFSNNYSASRAALEMFKLIVSFERKGLSGGYYAPIARERQRLRSLAKKIPSTPAYRKAILSRDEFTLAGYEKYRFTGVIVPHVDPLKEVNAAIARMSATLSTHDQESEALGTGDFRTNAERLKKEKEILDLYGLSDDVGEDEEKTSEEDGDGTNKKA